MTAKKPTHWIVSTLTAPMEYTTYGKGGGDLPRGHVSANRYAVHPSPPMYICDPSGQKFAHTPPAFCFAVPSHVGPQ